MTELKRIKNKHLTIEDRNNIQDFLDHGMTFKTIGRKIGKDQTTVSKEVKKHVTDVACGYKRVDEHGKELPSEVCPQLLKAPFVCNPCSKRHHCRKARRLYQAKNAHSEYKELLTESRTGIPLNKEQFYENNRIISGGIRNGQHLYHILQTNDLGVSKSTVYRHVKQGYLSLMALDFPRIVKFKPRKKNREDVVPKVIRVGRSHEEFLAYCMEHGMMSWAEMDTVIGRMGGKAILTFDFTLCNFMFGLLLENKTAAEVSEKVRALKARLSAHGLKFGEIFPLILTDNGGEFADVFSLENAPDGSKETDLFFCDPYKACQKPKVEKNHTLFRDIVPKGRSFDRFSQDTVNLVFSHVNSVKRKSLNGKSPFEVFAFAFGPDIPSILGIVMVDAAQVVQSPLLLRELD
jgi:IS30 family transposase